ncbi:MAG TPA: 4Fe-4S binding protein [Candidatus Ozemobacteraceae bacterium]|nr:4Fe-4S binding protein [Candidatus Ozemobacteraceae bacterium]
MTYGNFDEPGLKSFVNRLEPGVPDHASAKRYAFDQIHWHPLIFLVGILFPALLLAALWRNKEFWLHGSMRAVIQWIAFVTARIGVIRASAIWPLRRSCLGTFPFLNCQACEMASGACPIGLFQNLLAKSILPVHLIGSMLLFGLVLGKSICGWLCPFGFISDIVDRFSLKRWKIPRGLANLRYWVLALVVIAPLAFVSAGITGHNFFCSTVCASGKIYGIWPYWLTTASPSFFPVGSWLSGAVGDKAEILFHIALTLLLVLAMVMVSGRIFCRVLCPLGGLWGLFNGVSLVGIEHGRSACSGCGACESVCPMGVSREFAGFADRTSCMSCGRCIPVCRTGARRFRFGPAGEKSRGETEMSGTMTEVYGGFWNRLRRDLFLVVMRLAAKTPLGMARYAFEQTAFYRRLYGRPPAEFESLPLTIKKELGSADPYDVLADAMRDQVVLYGETTGSTGYPTPSFFTTREFHGGRALARITPYIGLMDGILAENRAVVNGLTFGFTVAGMTFGDLLGSLGGLVANVGTRSTIATPERMARALRRLRPSVLTGTPIDILSWMRIVKEDTPDQYPRLLEHLKLTLSTAELCAASRSRAISKEFGFKHIDVYACVEGFFSLPCPCGEKHVLPIYHPEIFDERLTCIGTRGEGRFAYTNLLKKSSPLVRYLLDDFVTVADSACPYGFTVSIEPHGRWELTVVLNGRRMGVRHFEEAIFSHGLFGDYRVVIEDDRIRVTAEEYGAHDSRETMARNLADAFGQRTEVDLVPFGTITKYREIRQSKPILKIEDKRSSSTQVIPEYL